MDKTKNIFILTGAGISKESGIKTFREKDGLWDNHRIEDVCTVQAFWKIQIMLTNFTMTEKKAMNNPSINQTKVIKFYQKLKKIGLESSCL